MEEDPNIVGSTFNTIQTENVSVVSSRDDEMQRCCSLKPGKDFSTPEESNMACKLLTLRSVFNDSSSRQHSEISEQLSPQAVNSCLITNNVASEHGINAKQLSLGNTEDKENTSVPSATFTPGG